MAVQRRQSKDAFKGFKKASKRVMLRISGVSPKNYNKDFAPFVDRLQKKGKAPKVIICAVMRKMMHIFFGMLKAQQDFKAHLAFKREIA
ncbi:hypothetical protein AGMMS49949_08390 [Alphaproteobacteria bacterium]|nr:hypothetical protein AGMMS49949_08390 [Alphaproteobacteria bacterium]